MIVFHFVLNFFPSYRTSIASPATPHSERKRRVLRLGIVGIQSDVPGGDGTSTGVPSDDSQVDTGPEFSLGLIMGRGKRAVRGVGEVGVGWGVRVVGGSGWGVGVVGCGLNR